MIIKKINILRISYWFLLIAASFMMATVSPEYTFKVFIMQLVIMICCIGAGYIDRIIDEEK